MELVKILMSNKAIKNIDFNCNLGDVSSLSDLENSFELMEYMSSVNVACGIHSGTPVIIKRAIEHCKFKNKVIGALIGLPDMSGDPLSLSDEDVEAIVLYQLGAISSFAKAYSLNIEHVRPDGLMYKLAYENLDFSLKIAKAVKKFNKWFILFGAAGNVLAETASEAGINVAHEICIEKQYANSSINHEEKDLSEKETIINRLNELLNTSEVTNTDGSKVSVNADTIHFSGANMIDIAKEASDIVIPRPVNFNKTVVSGWVE